MALIGILLADIILLVIFCVAATALIAVTVWSLVTLISGIVFTVKKGSGEVKVKEKKLGMVLLIAGSAVFATVSYVIFRLIQMFQ